MYVSCVIDDLCKLHFAPEVQKFMDNTPEAKLKTLKEFLETEIRILSRVRVSHAGKLSSMPGLIEEIARLEITIAAYEKALHRL